MLNVAGKRIGPAELESAALECPAVAEAAAIGVPHDVKGEAPWLFVVLKPDAEATAADVTAAVSHELEGVRAGPGAVRARASEDAFREDRAPSREGDGARKRPGRPLDAREPRGARGNPQRR